MKYKIYLREVIEPVGQEEWTEVYETEEKAWHRIKEINEQYWVEGWYMQAKEVVETVEIDKDLPFEKV